jgi:predicted DNA-binding transcriptional regulator AlpA
MGRKYSLPISLPDPLLTEAEAAQALRLKAPATLRKWRQLGTGPRFVKLGAGGAFATVRYRQSDLIAWIASRVKPQEPAE